MGYGKAALEAAKLVNRENINPREAWEEAVEKEFLHSVSCQEKGCPKGAFLGLCENGMVKNIPSGKYTKSKENKRYAINAVKILGDNKNKRFTPGELWIAVLKLGGINKKAHNSQMNVVLALWNNGEIEINQSVVSNH